MSPSSELGAAIVGEEAEAVGIGEATAGGAALGEEAPVLHAATTIASADIPRMRVRFM
jgi:hypothetical protein